MAQHLGRVSKCSDAPRGRVNQDFGSRFQDSEKPSALTELPSREWAPIPGSSCRADRALRVTQISFRKALTF